MSDFNRLSEYLSTRRNRDEEEGEQEFSALQRYARDRDTRGRLGQLDAYVRSGRGTGIPQGDVTQQEFQQVVNQAQPQEQDEGGVQWQQRFGGAVRGLASAIEPLQLPADVFQATVAGAIDEDTTIAERWGRVEWAKYMPFGEVPARPARGDEVVGDIMTRMGIPEEEQSDRVKNWAGFVFDIGADPLLTGSALRAGGAILRSPRLVEMGRRADRAMDITRAYRSPAADALVPGKRYFDARASELLDRAMNARVFWESGDTARTYGDVLAPRRTMALERQMPGFGRDLHVTGGLARQHAREVAERSLGIVEEAQAGVLGRDAPRFIREGLEIMRRGRRAADETVEGIPAGVRDTIFAQAYDVGDQVGFSAMGRYRTNLSPELREFAGARPATRQQKDIMRAAREKVVNAARQNNFDEFEAANRFDLFLERITEADALLGYHLSGVPAVRKLFSQRMQEVGMDFEDAMRVWRDLEGRGIRGEPFLESTRIAGRSLDDWFGEGTYATVGDMLRQETSLRGLDLETYFRSLGEGHLRRSYGLFQDPKSFDNWLATLRAGRVIPSSIIDEDTVHLAFGQDTPELAAFQEYVRNVTSSTRDRGVLLRQGSMMEAIRDRLIRTEGISAREASRRAQQSVGDLIKSLQAGENGGAIGALVDRVMETSRKYVEPPPREGGMRLGRAMFRQREELSREMLDTLGELALPQVSLREGAMAARSQVAWADYMSDVYRMAARDGYVVDAGTSARTRGGQAFRTAPDDPEVYGGFAGRKVQPFLLKEINREIRQRAKRGGIGGRLRSLVTGGYLASPSMPVRNIFGGLTSSAFLGISPARMLREMRDTVSEFRRASMDPNYSFADLEDLKRYIPIDDTTLVDANIERGLRRITGAEDLSPRGLRATFDNMANWIQDQLDRPLGSRTAGMLTGLEGFQFSENWMKVSAFRAYRRMRAAEEGIPLSEFRRAVRNRSDDVLRIEKEAAEAARQAVFDYCVDEQTEALTRRGWLHVDEIDPDADEVLTVNPESGVSEWQALKDLYVGPARPRRMRRLSSSRFDAFVTNEHRWITETTTNVRNMKELKDFGAYDRIVAAGGELNAPTEPEFSDELVELIGWYVTEGTDHTRGYSVQIAQSLAKNPEYVMQLRALAEFYRAQGATVTEYQRDIGWGTICSFYFGQGIGRILREAAPGKRLTPDFLTRLTRRQLELLFDTLIKADGHARENAVVYTQQDPGRLDDFQMLAGMLGYRTGRHPLYQNDGEGVTVYRTKHVYFNHLKDEEVEYEGRVWCPVTENGTWFARRNGFTYWTGNSDIPDLVGALRNSGLLLFPSFPMFMTARTISGALKRPGTVAATDRLSDAINDLSMDFEERIQFYAGLPDWLKEEQGVMIPGSERTDEAGDTRRLAFPMNQVIPTQAFTGNPWLESAATIGIYSPFVEAAASISVTDGRAPFSAKYGTPFVSEPGRSGLERFGQTMGFLANNLAPGGWRKLASYKPGEGFSGIVPSLMGDAIPMNRDVADSMYSVWEVQNQRASRGIWDNALAAVIGSPQVITMSGPLSSIKRNVDSSRQELDRELSGLRRRVSQAILAGDLDKARDLRARIKEREEEWVERMRPVLEALRASEREGNE